MPTRTRRLAPDDAFAFRNAAEVQIAPDGQTLCHLLTTRPRDTDTRHTVLMVSAGGAAWREVPDSTGAFAARWSPDGMRLAFLTGGVAPALHVHALAEGATRTLLSSDTALRELAWSPDGTRLAFQQREIAPPPEWLGLGTPGAGESWAAAPKFTDRLMFRHDTVGEWPEGSFQTFVVTASGGDARQVTEGPWWHGMPHLTTPGLTWLADGARLLMTASRRTDWDRAPNEVMLYEVEVETGAVNQLLDGTGMASAPAVSPDGLWIAFLYADASPVSHRPKQLWVMPATGGAARLVLDGFDRSIDSIAWADDEHLLVCHDDPGCRSVGRVALADGSYTPLLHDMAAPSIEMPYSGGGFSVARDGTIAYLRGASDRPGDVAVRAPSGETTVLTHLNAALAEAVGGFRAAEMLWHEGGEERQVQSWLLLPEGDGPHPLVLEIHGGPYAQYGDRFSMKHQMLAAAGYAVLAVNPCGSTGYGEAFANALHDRFPGPDHDDLLAVLDAVAARPEIDADNLFITGVSGGGVLTLWGVAHSPVFRAAVAIKPVVSWESWLLTADMGPTGGLVWMGDALPWEDPEKYRARSPLAQVERIHTPTLLMAGEADSRTPPTEALQMYAALKLAGVETALLRFPGTSHSSGAMRPSLFAAEVAATIGWFERFREPSAA
jgi:dipeptidyl aminopeptidase/acylaminoacyl peptidase